MELNKRTFDGIFLPIESVKDRILQTLWDWFSSTAEGCGVFRIDIFINIVYSYFPTIRLHSVRKVPPMDSLKLNFDGSSIGNPDPIEIGGLLRDHEGSTIFSYVGPCGNTTANQAEISSLLPGLKIIVSKGISGENLIEGDSFNVIKWCKQEQRMPWSLHVFRMKIIDLCSTPGLLISFSCLP
ncbi:uncharacterized protein LOC105420578 [Amborella trichopoda]|uniref:uncharacterized protein LOC105420578 n=1 Tax=Amborella trichopoda TaxID=13333 RepID=UPI0005D2F234|nr:uncharacterized protein LOC105420578 [Amborella trichopoda]|eukprot:XP_011622986.1 uncharacterized protein LOC105420578 [Amborella trichopoda]